ncbi:MAG: hypothetical protein AB7I18_11595 [Candidatus Berkiella sp.]
MLGFQKSSFDDVKNKGDLKLLSDMLKKIKEMIEQKYGPKFDIQLQMFKRTYEAFYQDKNPEKIKDAILLDLRTMSENTRFSDDGHEFSIKLDLSRGLHIFELPLLQDEFKKEKKLKEIFSSTPPILATGVKSLEKKVLLEMAQFNLLLRNSDQYGINDKIVMLHQYLNDVKKRLPQNTKIASYCDQQMAQLSSLCESCMKSEPVYVKEANLPFEQKAQQNAAFLILPEKKQKELQKKAAKAEKKAVKREEKEAKAEAKLEEKEKQREIRRNEAMNTKTWGRGR